MNTRRNSLNLTNFDQLIFRNHKWLQFLETNGEHGEICFINIIETSNKFKEILHRISRSPKASFQNNRKFKKLYFSAEMKNLDTNTLREFKSLNELKQSILRKISYSTKEKILSNNLNLGKSKADKICSKIPHSYIIPVESIDKKKTFNNS